MAFCYSFISDNHSNIDSEPLWKETLSGTLPVVFGTEWRLLIRKQEASAVEY
ncbi:predicted protein [Botrytis cinerea T4]|uniref:Uncharacterized protein n=1 Tax=Botryotinia fuckeliana (strain T4) TaxID=999810 RepID=G2YEE3_BOTF4|nr:predicted protein [Botrytis cinerea T4]